MSHTSSVYQPTAELEVSPGIFRTPIEGLLYIQYQKFLDERGFFVDITALKKLEAVIGRQLALKQINLAYSNANVVRGLHAEGWNKVITILAGRGVSVLVDIRPDSPTFKQVVYFSFEPQPDAPHQAGLYIPMGVANSIAVVEGPLLYHYAVDAFYDERDTTYDTALSLFDPELNIQWPVPREQMVISERDAQSLTLQELLQQRTQADGG